MSQSDFKQMEAYRCGCPGCGNAMRYDIRARGMVCDSCGESRTVSGLPDADTQQEDEMLDVVVYTCPSCGATLNSSQGGATSFCSYCGSDVVLTARLDRIRRPKAILPFRITREECEGIYRKHISQARFAPKSLSDQQTIDHFRPVYIPYWQYSFRATGDAKGQGAHQYSDSSYDYTDEYKYSVSGTIEVQGAVFDASSAFDDETAQQLSFRFKSHQTFPFHPAYLCGIYTETPDVGDVVYLTGMKSYAEEAWSSAANRKTGTTGHCALPEDCHTEADLILLPVWLLANRQGERVLYTAVNGMDGTIVCDPPVSNRSNALLTAGMFCGILAVLLLLSHVIILRPNILLGVCGLLAALGLRRIVKRTDEILIRRAADPDPTRSMKRLHPSEDVALEEPLSFSEAGNKDNLLGMKIICGSFIGFCLFVFLIYALTSGSRVISAIISDRGIGAPLLLIIAMILLVKKNYTYHIATRVDKGRKPSGPLDVRMLYLMRILCGAGIVVTILPVPGKGYICYGISIAIMLLFSLNMIRLNRLHNEYVTRPVPFFGKEAER